MRCGGRVVEVWGTCGCGVVGIWGGEGKVWLSGVVVVWLRCGGGVVEVWLRCGCGVGEVWVRLRCAVNGGGEGRCLEGFWEVF